MPLVAGGRVLRVAGTAVPCMSKQNFLFSKSNAFFLSLSNSFIMFLIDILIRCSPFLYHQSIFRGTYVMSTVNA